MMFDKLKYKKQLIKGKQCPNQNNNGTIKY